MDHILESSCDFSIHSDYEQYALDIVWLREIPLDSFYWGLIHILDPLD